MVRLDRIKKINPPSWPCKLIPRQRLFNQLNQSLQRISWVYAPAGSGKTALISSWQHQRQAPLLWYQLGKSDNHAEEFFGYMRLALSRFFDLETPNEQSPQAFNRYIEQIYTQLPAETLLVFDDYHMVQQSWLHQFFYQLQNMLPTDLRLVFISRRQPHREIISLKASNRIQQLDDSDLKLTRAETRQLLQTLQPAISRQQIGLIYQQATGWVTGSLLLQQSLPANGQPHPGSTSQLRGIFDYFEREIFQNVSQESQSFLLRSSHFEQFNIDSCERHNITESGKHLRYLFENQCFIKYSPQPAAHYHYHPLFQAFLQAKARHLNNTPQTTPEWSATTLPAIKIYTLGTFEIIIDQQPLQFNGKLPKKVLDLLKALIAYGGQQVCCLLLADTLWPDNEGDSAHRCLKYTLHCLRKLLGNPETVLQRAGRLSLNPELCWVDILHQPAKIHAQIEGEFLPGDHQPWINNIRKKLHKKLETAQ